MNANQIPLLPKPFCLLQHYSLTRLSFFSPLCAKLCFVFIFSISVGEIKIQGCWRTDVYFVVLFS